jgi:hypothetical protein
MTVKQIFFIDASGAAVSVILMGLILPAVQLWHGMPMHALFACGIWATVSLIYSTGCFGWADLEKPKWLQGIMFLNTAYCGFTFFLVISHRHALSLLGFAYFLAEILVILGLVLWERHVYRTAYCS